MIDTTNLNGQGIEELRASIVLQRKEIDRLREEITQVAEYNEGLTTRCIEDTSRIAALEQQLASRGGVPDARWLDAVSGLVDDIECLIDESEGVYGMHLNGDPSPWSELESGGRFERLTHLPIVKGLLAAAPSPEGQEAEQAREIVKRWVSWIEDVSADMDYEPGAQRKLKADAAIVLSALTTTPKATATVSAEGQAGEREYMDEIMRDDPELAEAIREEQEREAFENWFSDDWQHPEAVQRDAVGYKLAVAQNAWTAWQAAWQALAALAAQQQEGRE
jgi:hypothetical protein